MKSVIDLSDLLHLDACRAYFELIERARYNRRREVIVICVLRKVVDGTLYFTPPTLAA